MKKPLVHKISGRKRRPLGPVETATRTSVVLALALGGWIAADPAVAQTPATGPAAVGALERNLPPAPPSGGGNLRGGAEAQAVVDDTPLGVDLAGIRIIGLNDPVATDARPGIDVSASVEGLDGQAFQTALAPFVGRPLSRKLLADAQAAIALAYRTAGRPFVSVTAPPQEITGGVLQLRVAPFKTGAVRVREERNVVPAADTAFGEAVRATPGKLIEAKRIAEDLEWLNRFPFRQLNGVFEPGSDPGMSNLTLEVGRRRPWQAFAGWSNASTMKTRDLNRYFLGVSAGIEAWRDFNFSYQLTGSRDLLRKPGAVRLSGENRPSYLSHAGRLVLALAPRQAISLTPNFVATSQAGAGNLLNFRNTTVELPLLYRAALSNLDDRLAGWGDFYAGITPKWLSRRTLYQGIELGKGSAALFDVTVGWSGEWQDAGEEATSVDIRLVGNRGGILPGNRSGTWTLFTNGRVADADYLYAYGTFNRNTPLPQILGTDGLSWSVGLAGQLSGRPLPDTEQLALGGMYAARGYTLNDGSADAGFVLRNELRLGTFALLGRVVADPADGASPFAFLDVAYGYNYNAKAVRPGQRSDVTLVGLGAGVDYSLAAEVGGNAQAGVNVGLALTDGRETTSGTVTLQGRLFLSF